MKNDSREFREWMRETMRVHGWRQADFARAVDIDSSIITRWMQGRQPRPEMVRKVAQKLGADQDELLRMAGHRRTPRPQAPERAHLIAKLDRAELTPDRERTLDLLLESWRPREQ